MKSLTKCGPRTIPDSQFQISLPMQSVLSDVQHAIVGLCVHAGKQVLAAMMQPDRAALCGPKGVPDASRRAVRGGTTGSKVVLGGQRIDIRRLRVRDIDAGELQLPTFAWAASADPLNAATDERHRRGRIHAPLCQDRGPAAAGRTLVVDFQQRGLAPLRGTDPAAKIQAQQLFASRNTQRQVQHLLVGEGPRRVGPNERQDGTPQQHQATECLLLCKQLERQHQAIASSLGPRSTQHFVVTHKAARIHH